jgi:regulator of protease activity HflC (stomatin/prohibitin superfamily)
MIWFIIGCIFAIITIIGITIAIFADDADRVTGAVIAVVAGIITVVTLVGSSVREVPVNSLGVPTAFGKVETTIGPGLHYWNAPWTRVNIENATVQTLSLEGPNCLTVRIADAQTACVDVSVQYTVEKDGGSKLFETYNNSNDTIMDNIQNNFVLRRLEVDLSNAFETYNPVTSIQLAAEGTPVGTPKNPSVTDLSASVVSQLRSDMAGLIDVRDVLIPRIAYDPSVESALNSVLKQTVATSVAEQAVKTAQAQAAANKALAASVSNDPGVLVSKCLDAVNTAIQDNYPLPAGFSCFSASTVSVLAGNSG